MHAEARIPRSHKQASMPFGKTAARAFFSGLGSSRPAAAATPPRNEQPAAARRQTEAAQGSTYAQQQYEKYNTAYQAAAQVRNAERGYREGRRPLHAAAVRDVRDGIPGRRPGPRLRASSVCQASWTVTMSMDHRHPGVAEDPSAVDRRRSIAAHFLSSGCEHPSRSAGGPCAPGRENRPRCA